MLTAIRQFAKQMVEGTLGHPAIARRSVGRRRGCFLILAYHNIVPIGEHAVGEHSLHTDQTVFGDQLDAVAEILPFVSLRTVLDGEHTGPAAVITFDDAYHGALLAGGEELARRGLNATVFVTPAFLGGRSFWWDAFADPETGTIAADRRHAALVQWGGDDHRVRAGMEAAGQTARPLPPHATGATDDALRDAARSGRFDVASHTWSHRNLAVLDETERHSEIERTRAWLADRFTDPVPALALPYGLGVEYASQAAGPECRAVLRIDGGWAMPGPGFQVLPRLNVPRGLSPGGLRLRITGLIG